MIRKEFPYAESFEESFEKLEDLWRWHIKEMVERQEDEGIVYDEEIEQDGRLYRFVLKPEKVEGTDIAYPRIYYQAYSRKVQPTTLQERFQRPEGKRGHGIRLTLAEDENGNGILIAECFLEMFESHFNQILRRLGYSQGETGQQPTKADEQPQAEQSGNVSVSVDWQLQLANVSEPSKRKRNLRAKTRYRCTLVHNRVKSGRDTLTNAIQAIRLDYESYQECERQNQFLTDKEMMTYLNERTEDQAWENEVNDYNAI